MKKEISYQVSLEEDENKLEQVLRRSLELSPREIRRAKFRPQGICVNGVRRRVTETVRQGERITVCLEEEGDGQDQLYASPRARSVIPPGGITPIPWPM